MEPDLEDTWVTLLLV